MRRFFAFTMWMLTLFVSPVLLADGQAPQAANFSAMAASDCPNCITLLVWDDTVGNTDLNCSVVTPPVHGTVSFEYPATIPTNSYKMIYTSTNGFVGTDRFAYKANDGTLDSLTATCTVTVTTNTAPVSVAKMAEACCGCSKNISLNALDYHTDVKYLGFTIVTPPTLGTLVYRDPGTYPTNSVNVVYIPTNTCSGTDTFTYTASDGLLVSGLATCTVTIIENQVPNASDSSQTAASGCPRHIWLNGWDAHTPQSELRFEIATPPTNGTVVYKYSSQYPSNSMEVYYTATNGVVDDSFTYTVSDGCDTSVVATCSIDVQTNTPPTVNPTRLTVPTNSPVKDFWISTWDGHTEQSALACTIESQPANGVIGYKDPGIYPTNSVQVTLTLTNQVIGTNTFTYRVSDGYMSSALVTGEIVTVVNTAPTASDSSQTLTANQYRQFYMTVSDSETSASELECWIVSPPAHGIVTHFYSTTYPYNSRYVRYTPFPGYSGGDSFTFKASDGSLESSLATVTLTVEANTAPTASATSATTVELVGKPITLQVSDNEMSSYYLACIIVDPPDHGTVVYQNPDSYPIGSQSVTYTADEGYDGPDSFTFKASDGELVSGVATCSITVEVNTAPVASAMSREIVYDTPIHMTLDVSDTHTAASQLECFLGAPAHGTVTYIYPANYPDNSMYVTYTPTNAYVGPDSFTFWATDGSLTSTPATCSIDVTTNSPPQAYDLRTVTTPDTAVDLLGKFKESDIGQTITASLVSNAVNGSVTLNGMTFTYTPDPGYTGMDFFTYKVNDGLDDSNIALVRVQVREADDRASNLVVLVVNDILLPVVSNEVYRLVSDLETEGYTTKVTPWTGSSASDLWNYLRSEYDDTNQFLQGSIFIGNVPKVQTYDYHSYYGNYRWMYNDLVFWNMNEFQTEDDINDYHIWVSRIAGSSGTYGTEEEMIKRALDANHYYRSGKSRLAHKAYYYHAWQSYSSYGANMLDVWPDVVVTNEVGGDRQSNAKFFPWRTDINESGADALVGGSDVFQETSHGNSGCYMNGRFVTADIFRLIAQQRYCMIESCTSGAHGGIVNQHIFSRGGGCVYAVGGTAINYVGDYQTAYSGGSHVKFRDRLVLDESFGGSLLHSYIFRAKNRTVHYGDLSMPVMMSPSNSVPIITDISADDTTITLGDSVTITIQVSDPDAASSDSPHADYEHQVEWFMYGHDYGRNDPTVVTNDNGASWTNLTYTYTNAGSYTIRAEVVDEWKGRGWKQISVTVNTPPIASNDTASVEANHAVVIPVLTNDFDADGHDLSIGTISAPAHGIVHKAGDTIVYTSTNSWTGEDVFTYDISDPLGGTDSATVTVTVVQDSLPPELGSAESWASNTVTVTFNEKVELGNGPNGAENPANYGLNFGANVLAAVLDASGTRVTLTTTLLHEGLQYVLTVNNVQDIASTPNVIASDSQVAFTYQWTWIWVEDAVPDGASTSSSGGDSWNWVQSNPSPLSGTNAHKSNIYSSTHQHYFNDATQTMAVVTGETVYSYIYLDPDNIPDEVMIQLRVGSDWNHRAYWGANLISWGTDGTVSRRYMGPLPAAGQWVRLDVPADLVGVVGETLNGMAFALYGGRATWDKAGKYGLPSAPLDQDGDGITDAWEIIYHGNTNTANGNPTCDTDQDGQCDLDEFLLGTNPTNAASKLEIVSCGSLGPGPGFVVEWQSRPGKTYKVLGSTNLSLGFDVDLTNGLLATPPQNCYTDTVDRVGPVYYRVLLDE